VGGRAYLEGSQGSRQRMEPNEGVQKGDEVRLGEHPVDRGTQGANRKKGDLYLVLHGLFEYAAVGGRKTGKLRWKGSNRNHEGAAAAIALTEGERSGEKEGVRNRPRGGSARGVEKKKTRSSNQKRLGKRRRGRLSSGSLLRIGREGLKKTGRLVDWT